MSVAQQIKYLTDHLGDLESPPGSNHVDIWDEYRNYTGRNFQGQPWCGATAFVASRHGGFDDCPADIISVSAAHRWGAENKRYNQGLAGAKTGDWAIFKNDEHIETIEKVITEGRVVQNLGGNTSDHGYNPNGGGLYRNTRSLDVVQGYVVVHDLMKRDVKNAPPVQPSLGSRPTVPQNRTPVFPLQQGQYYGLGGVMKDHGLMVWQDRMRVRGWNIGVDGVYGPGTQSVAQAFQKEKGIRVDGKIGSGTWAMAWTASVT